MTTPRYGATATLLKNGKVLIAGGTDGRPEGFAGTNYLASADLYDPQTGTFTPTGSMPTGRIWHTATLLADGRVLIAGGTDGIGGDGYWHPLASAYAYDPAVGTFSVTGSMTIAKWRHSATLLTDGEVLIAGGDYDLSYRSLLSVSAELYDPRTGVFSPTGDMADGRISPTATRLSDGRVLVAGGAGHQGCGIDCPGQLKASAELYDPKSGSFSRTGSMSTGRWFRTATLLSDGRVLMTGGDAGAYASDTIAGPIPDAEIYDPTAGTFRGTGSMATARTRHTATLLPNGRVLVVGGIDGDSALASAEMYDPTAGTFTSAGSMSEARDDATATLLPDGRVLICGGSADASAELYTP
jgi:hypothetical protein